MDRKRQRGADVRIATGESLGDIKIFSPATDPSLETRRKSAVAKRKRNPEVAAAPPLTKSRKATVEEVEDEDDLPKATQTESEDDHLKPTAEALKPTLYEWIDEPQEAICFVPDEAAYFKWRAEHRMTIGELEKHEWTKGDDFIVDFGGHRVGYLSFHLGAVGVNIDAPCRLRLVFGETNVDWLPTDVSLPRRYSFRYVRIQILDNGPKFCDPFSHLRATAVSAVDPSAPVPALPLADAQLRAIDVAAMHTLRDCMHAVFEDGPRRDHRLWLCDLRLQALANYATFAHFALVKRCLHLFAAVPRTNASLPACVYDFPALRGASDYIVDYDALFGVTLAEYVAASGDLETGRALWETTLGSMRGPLAHIDPPRTASSARARARGTQLFPDAPPPFAGDVARMMAGAAGFLREEEGQEPLFVSGPDAQVSWASAAWLKQ
ncbi:hypothetical protein C8R44DRAFT_985710 [Mycena epipterygia]|nr:hypothetical protein C8R44DRAFT_985710 [Mycena epipterygia]